jgi:hypothetical protein
MTGALSGRATVPLTAAAWPGGKRPVPGGPEDGGGPFVPLAGAGRDVYAGVALKFQGHPDGKAAFSPSGFFAAWRARQRSTQPP